jgi:glycosyltransferase involved in cell wall biosynthesis
LSSGGIPPLSERGPLVSVIIAAYNAEAYIAETCRSVLNQTHRAIELIVVDDGSTDATAAIVSSIADTDSRVRLIRQRNLGVAAARNCAMAVASGEFIAPLDADDLWVPTKIERQVQRMEESGPDTGMVYSWWALIDLASNVIDHSPRWTVEGRVLERLVEVNITGNASVPLYRRSCLEAIGGYDTAMQDAHCHGCEDWDLAIRVAERYAVAVVPSVLVGYRRRNDSMTTDCDTMWRSQQLVIAAIADRQPSISRKVLRRSNGQFALYLAGVSFWSGRYMQAVRWALRGRPISLTLFVLPYAIPAIVQRLVRGPTSAIKFASEDARFDDASLGEPLIPYARIDARLRRPRNLESALTSQVPQIAAVVLAVTLSSLVHWQNDGLWLQGDSPRHAATGLFVLDLVRSLPADPLDYSLSYYARYPIIVPLVYPPLFYLFEASAFAMLTPTPYVAKGLVLGFSAVAGIYVALWARRQIGPIAGWAGALVVLMPAMVRYSNGVLLNVPTTALGLGALFHLQEWWSSENQRHRMLFVLLSVAAILTYYPGTVVIPVAMVWMVGSKRFGIRSGTVGLAVAVAIAVSLVLLVAFAFPLFFSRMAPSFPRLFTSGAWMFYLRRLPLLADLPWLALGALGLLWGIVTSRRREQAIRLALVYPTVLTSLVILPAYSDRYALLLTPTTVLAAFVGLAIAFETAGRWKIFVASAALVVMFFWTGWSGLGAQVPAVSGFAPIADYLRAEGPNDAVLYSGRYDGVFGFYMQSGDSQFDRRLVLTNRLLYRFQQDSGFSFNETPHVNSAADVVDLIRHQSGCRWVAVEIGVEKNLPVSDRYLRQALLGPEFERVRSFPVTAGLVTRVDLYRVTVPVDPAPPMDLQFPSFSRRVFRGIEPIGTRH